MKTTWQEIKELGFRELEENVLTKLTSAGIIKIDFFCKDKEMKTYIDTLNPKEGLTEINLETIDELKLLLKIFTIDYDK